MADTNTTDDATRKADEADARSDHGADREPTAEEAKIAEQQGPADDSVAEHFQEMSERGANVKGEGAIDGSPGGD